VRHVDDAHDAKRNGQSDGDQNQHRPQAQAKKQRLDARIEGAPAGRWTATAAAAACRTFSSLSTKLPSGDFEQERQPVPHILADAVAQRGDRRETRLALSGPSSAASARPVAISFLTPEFVSTRAARAAAPRSFVQRPRHLRTASKAHRCIRARQPEVRHVVSQMPQAVVRADFGQAIRGADPALLQRKRIDQIEGIRIGRLDDKNLLIAVAEIEPVFQQRREDRANARMTASGSAVRQYSPCRSTKPPASSPSVDRKALRPWEIGRVPELRPKGRAAAQTATARPRGGISLLVVLS
jgi:hypothetical protein